MNSSLYRSRLAIAVGLAALALICSCVQNLAGNSSGGEARTIAGRFVDRNGTGVENAVVVLKEQRQALLITDSAFLDKTRTGHDGAFRFAEVPPGAYWLEARSDDTSLVALAQAYSSDTGKVELPADTMKTGGALEGAIGFSTGFNTLVSVQGTPYFARVKTDNSFMIRGIPPGYYSVHTVVGNDSSFSSCVLAAAAPADVRTGETITLDTIFLTRLGGPGSVLTENFSACNARSALTANDYWWWFSDSSGTTVQPPEKVSDAIMAGPGYGGTGCAAHIRFTLASADRWKPYCGIGTGFRGEKWGLMGSADLSNVSKISFRVKGKAPGASLRVRVFSRLNREANYVWRKFDSIPAEWMKDSIDFTRDEFDTSYAPGHPLSWTNLSRFATEITFEVVGNIPGASGELWLDDVVVTNR